jgi:hypothetical protein
MNRTILWAMKTPSPLGNEIAREGLSNRTITKHARTQVPTMYPPNETATQSLRKSLRSVRSNIPYDEKANVDHWGLNES